MIGIIIFVFYCVLSALLNCVIRKVVKVFDPMLMVSYRSLGCIVLILPLLIFLSKQDLKSIAFKKQNLIKATVDFLSLPLWAIAVANIHISQAVSLSYLTPLFMAVFAYFLLKDKMELDRWVAMIVGFIGAYIVLLPDTQGFNFYSVFVLGTCVLWALGGVFTKTLSEFQHPIIIVLLTNIIIFLYSVPFANFRVITLGEFWLLLALSFLACSSHIVLACAFSKTRITLLLPFDYIRLVFAAMFAFIFYDEVISVNTGVGAVVIMAAATYITRQKYSHMKQTNLCSKPGKG